MRSGGGTTSMGRTSLHRVSRRNSSMACWRQTTRRSEKWKRESPRCWAFAARPGPCPKSVRSASAQKAPTTIVSEHPAQAGRREVNTRRLRRALGVFPRNSGWAWPLAT